MQPVHNDTGIDSYKWAKKIRLYLSLILKGRAFILYVAGLGTGALVSTFSMASASCRFC